MPAPPGLEEPLAPGLEEPLAPELEEPLAPESTLVDSERDELSGGSHPVARKTAPSARASFSRRRIDHEPLDAHGLPTRPRSGETPLSNWDRGAQPAPLNASRMRALRSSVRWLSFAPVHYAKADICTMGGQ